MDQSQNYLKELKLTKGQRQRVDKYFPRAIEAGYITVTPDGPRWRAGKGECGKFRLFVTEMLGGGGLYRVPTKEIEAIFNQPCRALCRPAAAREIYDEIFYD